MATHVRDASLLELPDVRAAKERLRRTSDSGGEGGADGSGEKPSERLLPVPRRRPTR